MHTALVQRLKMKHRITNTHIPFARLAAVAFLFALPIALLSAPAAAIEFTDNEKNTLKDGGTVIHELPTSRKMGFYGGTGYAIIPAAPEVVWQAIRDWAAYPHMFPNTEYCKVVSRKGNRTLVRMKIGHPVVSLQYHAETTEDAARYTLSFRLVESHPHDLDAIQGYWRLFPQKNGTTLVAYAASVRAPMGIVALAGEDLANRAIHALLGIPGDLKKWVMGPRGKKYTK